MALRVGLSSVAVGSFLGWFANSYYESYKLRGTYEGLWSSQYIPHKPGLPIYGTVSAATPIESNISVATPEESTLGTTRRSQIMKHGFPRPNTIRMFEDYILSYDHRNRVANWVFEHITKESCQFNRDVDRAKCEFTPDKDIPEFFRSTNEDYLKSGFDRGHLAAAGNHKSNQRSCNETFHLSNIAPQVGVGFNRHAWNNLEKYTRKLTRHFKNVYICTGPLYLPKREADGKSYVRYQVIGKKHVAVPTHFFKIIIGEAPNDELHMESYVMPNEPIPDGTPLTNYLVPVESVERASGLLFFNEKSRKQIKRMNVKMLGE